jgi:hypothetical protein
MSHVEEAIARLTQVRSQKDEIIVDRCARAIGWRPDA